MFCSNCGKEISGMGKFCEHCGSALGGDERQNFNREEIILTHQRQNTIENTYQNTADHPEKKGRKIFMVIPILAVLGLAMAFLFYDKFMKTAGPEETVARLEKALNEMDIATLLDCFDEDAQEVFYESMGLDASIMEYLDADAIMELASDATKYMMEEEEMYEFSMDVIDVDYDGKNNCIVTVDAEIYYDGDRDSEEIELPMEKQNGKWVIDAEGFDVLF